MSNEYTKVRLIIVRKTDNAVLAAPQRHVEANLKPPEHWIPRSLFHAADDLRIGREPNDGRILELRLRAWKAEELDL